MFGRILVPTDGSYNSEKAVKEALDLAGKLDAEITILHVTPNIAPLLVSPYVVPESFREMANELKRSGTELLEKVEKIYENSGVKLTTKLLQGDPAVEIINEAKNGGYDLIIMANRGLGEIKEFLMGSVSNKVVKHAGCKVMIVK